MYIKNFSQKNEPKSRNIQALTDTLISFAFS